MRSITSLLAGIAVLASTLTTPLLSTPASALSLVTRAPVTTQSDIQLISDRDIFLRRKNGVYLNGVRGHNRYRDGYRRSNGFWFPAAAFLGGVIIGGAIVNGNNQFGIRHIRWCENRYRSYRTSSNSYQPYDGPRRICYSPYS